MKLFSVSAFPETGRGGRRGKDDGQKKKAGRKQCGNEENMNGIINDYLVYEDESIYKAYWQLHRNKLECIVVTERDGKFTGIMSAGDFGKLSAQEADRNRVGEVCNRNCRRLCTSGDIYAEARNIFGETDILSLPVVTPEGKAVDVFTRARAFYRQYYKMKKLPRMHYAYNIYAAALETKRMGYEKMSVMEFGVAGGSGLVNCEFHAREIGRLTGVEIEVYGFDNGSGLPEVNEGFKDLVHFWPAGSFQMDRELLLKRLECAEVILGNMKDTVPAFMEKECAAPIGVMLIDCDYYSSARDVLHMLEYPDACFLPRIYMYFDDVSPFYEFSGENLAIREFNETHEFIKISPEHSAPDKLSVWTDKDGRNKICHRFLHESYNKMVNCIHDQLLYCNETGIR